jgi:hypothetical protein
MAIFLDWRIRVVSDEVLTVQHAQMSYSTSRKVKVRQER